MANGMVEIAITTEFTKLFGIKHPISLAGMNVAAGPKLAAAVTNAGGIGVIGGVGYTPDMLKGRVLLLLCARISVLAVVEGWISSSKG
jgi:enoyl reductase-like protein